MAETPERFANMPPSSHTPTKAWDAGAEEPSCGVLCDRCIRHKPCASYQCSFLHPPYRSISFVPPQPVEGSSA